MLLSSALYVGVTLGAGFLVGRAAATFFCLDHSKLGRATPHCVAAWDALGTLITDATPGQIAAAGITLPTARLVTA